MLGLCNSKLAIKSSQRNRVSLLPAWPVKSQGCCFRKVFDACWACNDEVVDFALAYGAKIELANGFHIDCPPILCEGMPSGSDILSQFTNLKWPLSTPGSRVRESSSSSPSSSPSSPPRCHER